MEVIGWGGDVHDSPVGSLCLPLAANDLGETILIIVAHLQEPLESGGGVLGALALVAVREQHDEATLAQPLLLSRREELVDHALRRVGEITELCLPHDEGRRVLERVAHLEAQHTEFGEGRVARDKGGLARIDVLQWDVLVAPVDLVMQNAVAVGKGAPLDILPRNADVVPFNEERRPRKLFAERPVDAFARLHHGRACLIDLVNVAVGLEV
mmetsp:Transcript_5283/g.16144  ORF Transcript_5283/g.16144 Transcript_5283/m.16144 type:complete len:212 (+) Transcript_5283:115-750(+)